MKIVERFIPEQGTYEATLTNVEDYVLSICRYKLTPECIYVEWIGSNVRRKGYAKTLLMSLVNTHNKPAQPNIVLERPSAVGFWRFFLLEQRR